MAFTVRFTNGKTYTYPQAKSAYLQRDPIELVSQNGNLVAAIPKSTNPIIESGCGSVEANAEALAGQLLEAIRHQPPCLEYCLAMSDLKMFLQEHWDAKQDCWKYQR